MSKSLRVLALLAVSAVAGLATQQTVCAKERIWPPSGQDHLSIPRFGFDSYFNGYGERVTHVTPGSLAWNIGLEPRDVIVAVNGSRLRYDGQWSDEISEAASYGRITLSIRDCRSGRVVRRHIDLGMGDDDFDDGSAVTPKRQSRPHR